MAFAGFKKQLNKANQFVSEKMGTAEGTKLTEEYLDMERKTDATIELVDEMINKTKEYLQPNPATRAKMQLSSRVNQSGGRVYSQPEGMLGDTMLRSSKKLGDNNLFAKSLCEMGEAFREMAEVKFSLEDSVKQNFLDPLTYLQTKEIKDVNFHRKKLESRRLDYDCKKRRKPTTEGEKVELSLAQAKFEQSLNFAAQGMHELLQNQTEHINQLAALTQSLHEYHSQCSAILEGLTSRLLDLKNEAANQPQEAYIHKKLDDVKNVNNTQAPNNTEQNNGKSANNEHPKENGLLLPFLTTNSTSLHLINETAQTNPSNSDSSPSPTEARTTSLQNVQSGDKPAKPSCRALYDFDPENPGELGFKEGDIIELKEKIDDNWFQGELKGKTGMLPIAYVQVLVPLDK